MLRLASAATEELRAEECVKVVGQGRKGRACLCGAIRTQAYGCTLEAEGGVSRWESLSQRINVSW